MDRTYFYDYFYSEKHVIAKLSNLLTNLIPFGHEQLIFCCIGTDRSTGDALGPLIGHSLNADNLFPFPLYGTLKEPVHALNIEQKIQSIYKEYSNPFIVAIDACLSSAYPIGTIIIENKPIFPALAFNKKLPPIGHLSIKCVVNKQGSNQLDLLQSTRLHFIMELSEIVSRSLLSSFQLYQRKSVHYSNYNSDDNNARQHVGYSNFRYSNYI